MIFNYIIHKKEVIKWNQNVKNAVQVVVLNAINALAVSLLASVNRII
jgi:hypothetical protein